MLWPNDVWVADGHTFDAEVINPLTGQIFRPEITMVIDWGTRRIVGFSVNLAESTLATLDTLRDGVSRCGMYKVFYVDNGSGFDNAVVYEVNDRLGGTITHSLPYNSQARGVIERPHKTILVRLAKTFDSYIGADMDKEAATKTHKLSVNSSPWVSRRQSYLNFRCSSRPCKKHSMTTTAAHIAACRSSATLRPCASATKAQWSLGNRQRPRVGNHYWLTATSSKA